MRQIEPALVERAIAIIGADGISDEKIEESMLVLSEEPMLARRLIDWIPEAFAIVLIPHLAKVNLPTTFTAKSNRGKWMELELNAEPIFPIAVRIGADMFHSDDSRNAFKNIVTRSAIINAVNRALNQGDSLEGATLSGPAMIGIPAEIYEPASPSLWRRLFH